MNKEELIEYSIRRSDVLQEDAKEELIKYFEQLQQENIQLKEEADRYKRLIEYLKGLDFYEFELDYDYEENPVSNYYPADMEYHINNWLETEEIDKEEE